MLSVGMSLVLVSCGDTNGNVRSETSDGEAQIKIAFIEACSYQVGRHLQGLVDTQTTQTVCECTYDTAKREFGDDAKWVQALEQMTYDDRDPIVKHTERAMDGCVVSVVGQSL